MTTNLPEVESIRSQLRAAIAKHGAAAVARASGASPAAIARLAAGMGSRLGTVVLVQQALTALEAADAREPSTGLTK